MSHYKSNVRDLEFNLLELLDLDKALATGSFGDLDGDTVREMLAEASKLAAGPVAESFADGDRNPPTFDPETHVVTLARGASGGSAGRADCAGSGEPQERDRVTAGPPRRGACVFGVGRLCGGRAGCWPAPGGGLVEYQLP